MATNRSRVIFPAAALFAGPAGSTGQHFSSGASGTNLINQIPRAQSASLNFDVTLTDVNQLGQLAALDRLILESPTVSMDISWLLVDGKAESTLGFQAKGQATFISGQLDKTNDDRNYFILIAPEGADAIGNTQTGLQNVISVGNGFVSNYTLNLAVGQLPTASLTIEGLNVKVDTGSFNKTLPAVNPLNGRPITAWNFTIPTATAYTGAGIVSALRPGDIVLEFPANAGIGNILSGAGSVNIQSVNFSLPLSRETLNRLGSPFAFSRELAVPIQSTMTIEALQADLRESNLSDLLCNNQSYNFRVRLKKPDCEGTGANAIVLDYKNAKLQSQAFGVDIGGAATTSLTFQNQLAGLGDVTNGFFFSGDYS